MILAGLLLTACIQDLEVEVRSLRDAGRYLEALEVAADLDDPERERLHRVLTLWTAGDLGGALLEATGAPDDAPIDATQRELCWHGAQLALQLGVVELVRRFGEAGLEQAEAATDLSAEERGGWREGFTALLDDADALDRRLEEARAGTDRARNTTLGLGALVLLALGLLARR